MTMQHSFADGKYTVINDNGLLTALRNGEPWGRDLIGDNLVYWMLVEVDALKAQREELAAALQTAHDHIDMTALGISHCKDAVRILYALNRATGGTS